MATGCSASCARAHSNLDIHVETQPLEPIDGDIDALGIALRNLIDNALKHGGDGIPAVLANYLKAENIRSVNYRYSREYPITPCSLEDVVDGLWPPDLIALCECLDYQSCEPPDYHPELLNTITALFKSQCRHGIKSALWSI